MQQKFQALQASLSSRFLEREEVINGTLAAILAGEHVLFLGPPGTAKSQMARAIAESVRGTHYFEWLLTRFSTPEEVFGPISLKALKEDRFERITTGKLPQAHIAFLDEIFKSSSAILNALLSIVNERMFHNNGKPVPVPLISLIGASNELPQAEDLTALYDRFLVRFWVNYVGEGSFRNLVTLPESSITSIVTLAEIQEAQKKVAQISITTGTLDALEKLRSTLTSEGIQMSDRRWRQSLKLVKAVAWLGGRKETTADDLEILKHVAWHDPAAKSKIARLVASISNPLGSALLEAEDTANEVFQNAIKAGSPEAGAEANQKLKALQQELNGLAEKNPSQTSRIQEVKSRIQEMNRRVIKEILGLEI
ncbi:MAG: AAA family ATPase [Candidatus Tectomicrobia bacterium]|nr:AAA family ATPase [Candidatus Tectomicrobia bacterium]